MAQTEMMLHIRAKAAEFRTGVDQAKASLKGLGKEATASLNEVKRGLSTMTGGISDMAMNAGKSFKTLVSGFKGLSGAIAATGIGAIVLAIAAAIAGLAAAFKRSGEAGDKLAEIMGFLGGLMDFVIGKLVKLGEWLIKAFQDPKAAVQELWAVIKENLVTRFQGVVQLFQAGWEYIKNGAIGAGLAIEGIFSKEKREQAKQYFEEAAKSAGKMGEALVMITTGKTVDEIKAIGKEWAAAGKEGLRLAQQEDALMDMKIKDVVEIQRMETQLARTRAELAEQDIRTTEGRQKRQELYGKALKKQEAISQRRIAYAKAEYELVKAQAAAKSDTSDETRLKIAQAQAAYEGEITKAVEETLRFKKGEATVQSQLNAELAKQLEMEKKDQLELQDILNETALIKEKDAQKAAFMKIEFDKQAALRAVEGATNEADQKAAIEELYYQKARALGQQYFEENKALAVEQAAEADRIRQEQLDKDKAAQEVKVQSLNDYANTALSVLDSISQLQEAAMNKELAAAGDNEAKKEQIQKKYARKQKAIAISQALINGALAVTNLLANVPGSVINPATWIAIGAAGIATAAQVALIASQPLAKGGIAYGETLATVGEYANARTNPEVIAPLDKLKSILGTSGAMSGEVRFVIEQDKLVGVLATANQKSLYF